MNRRKISVMGFSAGAAVSVYVASQGSRISSLITCACPTQFRFATNHERSMSAIKQFSDIGIIKENAFPASIADWIAGFNKVRPIDWIEYISPRTLLIIQGTNDDVIDPASGRVLYERAGDPKEVLLIEGAGHRLRLEEQAMDSAFNWLTGQVS